MAKKNMGYKLDLAHQTLTMTASFVEAANDPESEEYQLVQRLRSDFPNLKVENRTHASPKHYKNSNGTVTTRNQFNKLTYERMEKFMNALDDGQKYLDEYRKLREKAAAMCVAPYAPVARWFMAQFPKYWENPLFYLDTEKLPNHNHSVFYRYEHSAL
jgi:hypothetical protein